MAGTIIYFVIMCLAALIMAGIGVSQIKSRKPVGFYTGVKPPDEKELRDVKAWNKKHGMMWILYGVVMIGGVLAQMIGSACGCNEVFLLILEIFTVIGGIFAMMWYHMRLEKQYRR